LQKASLEFAAKHDKYNEMSEELAWKPDSGNNAEEWRLLGEQTAPPTSNSRVERQAQHSTTDADLLVDLGDIQFPMFCRPVLSERHIGIDQGVKNFAIAIVEKTVGNQKLYYSAKTVHHKTMYGVRVKWEHVDDEYIVCIRDAISLPDSPLKFPALQVSPAHDSDHAKCEGVFVGV